MQRLYNYALQPMNKDEFVRIVTADQPDTPACFTYDAVLNTKQRPTLVNVAGYLAEGMGVLDARPEERRIAWDASRLATAA